MIGFLRVPSLLVWLTVLWMALWGDLTAGNMLSGLLVAIVVVAVARPTGVTGLERTYFRPVSALIYTVYFLVQMVKSNLIVAWEIITPGLTLNRAIIEVPMHTSSAGVVALVANSVTLTPGTVTIEVIEEPTDDGLIDRTLFVHVLHFLDVDSVRRDVLRLERLAIKAFGSRDELPHIDAELFSIAASMSDNGKSDNGRSDNGKSDNGRSDNGKPENAKPENAKPDNGKPENGKPENGKPDNGKDVTS